MGEPGTSQPALHHRRACSECLSDLLGRNLGSRRGRKIPGGTTMMRSSQSSSSHLEGKLSKLCVHYTYDASDTRQLNSLKPMCNCASRLFRCVFRFTSGPIWRRVWWRPKKCSTISIVTSCYLARQTAWYSVYADTTVCNLQNSKAGPFVCKRALELDGTMSYASCSFSCVGLRQYNTPIRRLSALWLRPCCSRTEAHANDVEIVDLSDFGEDK